MTRGNPLRKYTVGVPGLGQNACDRIQGLQLDKSDLSEVVERVVSGEAAAVWLDIQEPTLEDIAALERIFGIESSIVERLLCGVSADHIDPECIAAGESLYCSWAEVTASSDDISQYFSRGQLKDPETANASLGTTDSNDTTLVAEQRSGWTGSYIPVPPWLQPSATQVLTQLHLQRKPKNGDLADIEDDPQGETARRNHIQQVLGLIDRPMITSKRRIRRALERWGPGHEQWWREVLNSTAVKRRPVRDMERLANELLGRGARDLIGYRVVQIWIRGPVMITLHRTPSETIQQLMKELSSSGEFLRKAEPLALVQGLIECWVQATTAFVAVIDEYTDMLDKDLTHPVRTRSLEAASWTPVIARCRKASLALLRRCQINEAVLDQLCGAAHGLWLLTSTAEWPPLPLGRRLKVAEIAECSHRHQLGILHQQLARLVEARGLYKKAEQRLSRLHRILLDRQRLRLLSTQKEIHKYFRVLVTVELVFLPIELWYNVDNLNGITTPGELQPDHANDDDFWLTVVGMVVWAVAAIMLYTLYTKFFERK
ncbi:hypothetical protein EV183_005486 [Coemansia sp. RSA 2336]|nr:hypothetical protein EV183_005486 [Coemansia sp. RSA 2336]